MDSINQATGLAVKNDVSPEEEFNERLIALMPRSSMVLDLWDWDIRFEDTFDGLEDAAFAEGDEQIAFADSLADDFLQWIDQYDMDYNQSGSDSDEEFENWIRQQCRDFMKQWRKNVRDTYGR